MTLKQVIGWIMAAAPFVGLLILSMMEIGVTGTVIVFGGVAVTVVYVLVTLELLHSDKNNKH